MLGSWILALDSPIPKRLEVVDRSPGQPHTGKACDMDPSLGLPNIGMSWFVDSPAPHA